MDKQMSLSGLSDELSQVRTKKKEFLSQIERIVPWGEWIELIRPHYYKGERGNKPYDLERMLRIYLVQNLYDLSDKATVAEVIDSRAFSEFCGVESSNQVPDGDTLGRFRNLLLRSGLQEKLFAQVVYLLQERGLLLKKGTIVDSTLIAAPSSTKNREKKRDPEAHSVKKGNSWHFGYKAHIGPYGGFLLFAAFDLPAGTIVCVFTLRGPSVDFVTDPFALAIDIEKNGVFPLFSAQAAAVAIYAVLIAG